MRRFRFGIRTVLLLAAIVAFSMLIMLERQRYFREHVFVTVLDSLTGVRISEFQYRTWVITKDSAPRVEWSPWGNHRGSSPFPIEVPAYCRFHIEVLAIGVPNSRSAESGTLLVLPESSHNLTLRIANSYRATGVIVDSSTNEPLEGVVVAPLSRVDSQPDEQESQTDAKGRFDVYMDVSNEDLFAFHPKYQYRFWPSSSSKLIGLMRGMTIHGRVVDMDSGEPVPECKVDVLYRTGVPLAHNELPMGVSAHDDGTPAVLRSKSPPRTAVTGSDGCFELFMEPLALNTALQVHKEGWNGSIVFAMKIENKPIELRRGGYELAGQLVSEEGTPISEFSVSTTRAGAGMSGDSPSEHRIQRSDGHFCILSTKPFLNYTIRASGYSPIHGGSVRNYAKPLDSPVNERFRLSRGVSLSGTIEKTKMHTRETTVFLVDLRYCVSFDQVHSPRLGPPYSEDGYVFSDDVNRIQYESRVGSDGRYTFANLATGRYALLVLYGDQTVNVRPIEVGSDDIEVPKIALPALGNLKGIVKERTIDSSRPPNVETTVNAFAVYTLHRPGDPYGMPFRTNHRGEFSVENVPVGTVTIGPSGFGRSEDNEVICVPQVLREGITSLATSDLRVLCVILIDQNHLGWFDRLSPLKANLHGPVESQVFVEIAGERSRDGFQRLLVFGRTDLPSGKYSVDVEDGPVEFNIDFEYQRNQTPSNISLSHHWLSCNATRDRSGSMGGVKATLIRNKRPVSSTYLPIESSDNVDCLVQSTGPFDVFIHDFSNGYSLLKNVSFASQTIDLGDIVWKPGAKLVLSVNLSGLDVFPEKVTIRHEETGISFTENSAWNSSVEFGSVPPGKWFIEVTNTDPLLGKQTLISREIVVAQPEEVRLELRKAD